jgi:hypothetical protein
MGHLSMNAVSKPDADEFKAAGSKPSAPESKPAAQDDLKSLPLQKVEKKLGSSPDGLAPKPGLEYENKF